MVLLSEDFEALWPEISMPMFEENGRLIVALLDPWKGGRGLASSNRRSCQSVLRLHSDNISKRYSSGLLVGKTA